MPCPDDNHLAELLGQLYDDRELLDKTSQACYERATDTCFEWDTVASQFDEVFQEVLATVEEKPQIVRPKAKKKKKEKVT
jgi:glycosyltransferase involved in cell wall biosynthesis